MATAVGGEPRKAVCVSTVSIVGGRDRHGPSRARSHQSHQTAFVTGSDAACADPAPLPPMLLTVLAVFSSVAHILIILLPDPPPRVKGMFALPPTGLPT